MAFLWARNPVFNGQLTVRQRDLNCMCLKNKNAGDKSPAIGTVQVRTKA
jgi:hypothetical protein